MSVVPKIKGNGATPPSWLRKLASTEYVRRPEATRPDVRRRIKEDNLHSRYGVSVLVEHPREEDRKTAKIPAIGVRITRKM